MLSCRGWMTQQEAWEDMRSTAVEVMASGLAVMEGVGVWRRLIGHDGAVVMVMAVWAAGDEGALGVGTWDLFLFCRV